MLYLIGLGLYSKDDMSICALDTLKACDKVYAELYTSFYITGMDELESVIGKEVILLDRAGVEEHATENMLGHARDADIAFLVVGDPMVATTHSDIILQARKMGIDVRVVHASSIISAIAETGLQAYKFGKTTTVAYPEKGYKPKTPYNVIKENRDGGLHTLVLLDVKAEDGRYMSVAEGLKELADFEKEEGKGVAMMDALCLGVARIGSQDSMIKYGTVSQLMGCDFGGPPHAIVFPGSLHYMEEEMLELFKM